jgi:DNA-binding SARP family transcriptional activator
MIVLRALGTAEIDTGVTTLTPSQEIVFAAALYLILERGKRVSRARLASLLWPRVPEKARSHRLRQTILQLKKLGIMVRADRDNLQLSRYDARTDLDDLSAPDPAPVLRHDSLEFLPGYNPRLSESLRDWVDSKRDEVHAAATRILVHELERLRLQADWLSVENTAAKCLSLDGYNETAVLAQAEAAAMRGGKRKAVSILDRYIAEVGVGQTDLKLPATLLRRRVVERIPDSPTLLNADPPFVGREIEMAALTRSFVRARTGHGSGTLIVGDPGIGKSRLTGELGRFADLQGAHVQRVTCRRADVDRPLSLFVDIVPQLREMPGALGCAPETFAWLKRLTEFEQRSDDSRQVDSNTLFQNVRAALFDLLDSVSEERCLVILIEDVQWLDDSSAMILIRMVDWCATRRLFFLLNSRPGDNSFLDYAEKARLDTLALGPLKPVASAALLQSVALRPGDQPQPEFVNWCLAVAEGNPFFLQELAHQWIETGQRYEAPPSVTRVMQERLSRLTAEALQVLQTCAVLGDHATLDRVEKVLNCPPHHLLSAVGELSKAAMLSMPSDGKDLTPGQIQPRHDFLASAAVSRLPAVSLAFIHRRAADVLEKEIAQATMPTTLLWACANHRHNAGDKKRALSLGLSCAQHLIDVGLAEDACRRYEDSLAYCTSDEDRLAVLSPLSLALQLTGKWERTKEVLGTCIRLSSNGETGDRHSEFEVMLFQARHRSSLDFVTLLNDMLPCVKSHNASPQHRVSTAVVALKVASDVGPSAVLDTIYSEIKPFLKMEQVDPVARLEAEIIYQTMRGAQDLDVELLEKFALTARSLHGEVAYSHALIACSSSCRIAGRDEHAAKFIHAAFGHAVSHKLGARIAVVKLSTVRLYVATGNWVAARAALCTQQQYPIAEEDKNTRAEWNFFEGRVALEEGDLRRAEAVVSKLEIVPQWYSVSRNAACLALTLLVRLARGCGVEVIRPLVRDLESTHRINRDIANQDFEAHALFLGLAALGEKERGLDLLREYVKEHRSTRRQLSKAIQTVLGGYEVGLKSTLERPTRLVGAPGAL